MSRDDILGLIEHMGRDLAGAVTLGEPRAGERPGYLPIADAEALERIIEELPAKPFLVGEDRVSMSLAGAQEKLPVARHDGRLAIPVNGAPSTLILKPDNARLPGSVQNEALCMVFARRCGLRTAAVTTGVAGKRSYLLLERYDRDELEGWIALPAALSDDGPYGYASRGMRRAAMNTGMPMFSVRLPDDLAARFDATAAGQGGRSALLRRLVQDAARAPGAPLQRRPSAARLMVRLGPLAARHVEHEAAAMGLRRAGWVSALVLRHAAGQPTFGRGEEAALLAIQSEIHRIGLNVNQIARALNTAVLEGKVVELELADIRAFGRELQDHMAALREAFAGNLAYWDVGDG